MPSVHGNLKISLIGKPGALDRVADVMSSLKTYTGPAEYVPECLSGENKQETGSL